MYFAFSIRAETSRELGKKNPSCIYTYFLVQKKKRLNKAIVLNTCLLTHLKLD